MSTHRVTIELPVESYRHLRQLVDSGEYASESAAIAEALVDVGLGQGLDPNEPEFAQWMREEVIPAYDELEAHPDSGVSPEELNAILAADRLTRSSNR